MMMSMICVATTLHIVVHEPCGLEAMYIPLSLLPLTVKGKELSFEVVLMSADSQLRRRDMESFCDNTPPILKI